MVAGVDAPVRREPASARTVPVQSHLPHWGNPSHGGAAGVAFLPHNPPPKKNLGKFSNKSGHQIWGWFQGVFNGA